MEYNKFGCKLGKRPMDCWCKYKDEKQRVKYVMVEKPSLSDGQEAFTADPGKRDRQDEK